MEDGEETGLRRMFEFVKNSDYMKGVQKRFRNAEVKSFRSWGDLEMRLSDVRTQEVLRKAVDDLVFGGRKDIFVFHGDESVADQLFEAAEGIGDGRPWDLDPSSSSSRRVVSASTNEEGDFVNFALRSLRPVVWESELETKDLVKSVRDDVDKNSRVFVRSTQNLIAFDFVNVHRVPDTGGCEVEVRVTTRFNDWRVDQKPEYYATAVVSTLANLAGFNRGDLEVFNFFVGVRQLYNVRDGRVAELRFECGSGAVHDNRLRRSGRHVCLRDEPFHKAGVKEVMGEIDPYRIAVAWRHDRKPNPGTESSGSEMELVLPGQRVMLLGKTPLSYARVEKAYDMDDFDFIVGKLREHVM